MTSIRFSVKSSFGGVSFGDGNRLMEELVLEMISIWKWHSVWNAENLKTAQL